jgi:HJR/Mrr/RecB family endonuclease
MSLTKALEFGNFMGILIGVLVGIIFSVFWGIEGFGYGFALSYLGFIFLSLYIHSDDKRAKKSLDEYYNKIDDNFVGDLWNIIESNKDNIIKAYRHTVTTDVFGELDYNRFNKELYSFLEKKLSSEHKDCLKHFGITFKQVYDANLSKELPKKIREKYKKDLISDFDFSMSPREYELYCEDKLRKSGWDASATQASSDQGVDVEAKKAGIKIVVQCKRYKKAVGNKAVQEIVAGIKHYKANYGVVVAPSGYTKSAIKLAESNSIRLIHHDEIDDL